MFWSRLPHLPTEREERTESAQLQSYRLTPLRAREIVIRVHLARCTVAALIQLTQSSVQLELLRRCTS